MQKKIPVKQIIQILTALSIAYTIFLINAKPVDLPTADLGRHIINGKIILEAFFAHNKEVLNLVFNNNLYSYTEAEHVFVNHHWLSGVFYYLVDKSFGLTWLSFINVLLVVLANFFFFRSAQLLSNTEIALFITSLSLPISCIRSEVRPETISYLLLAVLIYLLVLFDHKKISFRVLLISASLIQLLWINCHIFFFLGFMSMFCFGLKYLLAKDQERIKQFLILAAVTLSVSMINPHGFAGLFYPLNIFDGYGYMTAENQSIFFMQKRYPMVLAYYYYELIVLVTLVSSIFTRKKNYFPLVLLASLCLILGLKTNRAMTLGALTAIPLLAYNLSFLTHKLKDFGYKLLFVTLIILSLFIYLYQFQLGKKITSFEFNPQVNQTAVFFKYNNIEGPIFNNFDIGGYLIYHLFPARRVFVDNRPEAYSEEFMQQIYLKALEDEASWQELDQQINFNVIYFYRHDLTEHGQPFLIRRLQDSSWVPVAVDQSNIILLKNNDKNVEIIEKYRLPDSMFRAVKV